MFYLAIQDSLSDDALAPLKSYKYQSVDKSFISRYVLKHYVRNSIPYTILAVRLPSNNGLCTLVECVRRTLTDVDSSEHGNPIGVHVHCRKCDAHRDVDV